MTDLTRARELIALAQELDAKATLGPWQTEKPGTDPASGFAVGSLIAAVARGQAIYTLHDERGTSPERDRHFIAASRTAWPETARLLAEQIAATEAAEAKLASTEKVIDRGRVLASVVQGWLREGRIASVLPGRTLERHSELDRFVDALAAHDASAPKEG